MTQVRLNLGPHGAAIGEIEGGQETQIEGMQIEGTQVEIDGIDVSDQIRELSLTTGVNQRTVLTLTYACDVVIGKGDVEVVHLCPYGEGERHG